MILTGKDNNKQIHDVQRRSFSQTIIDDNDDDDVGLFCMHENFTAPQEFSSQSSLGQSPTKNAIKV